MGAGEGEGGGGEIVWQGLRGIMDAANDGAKRQRDDLVVRGKGAAPIRPHLDFHNRSETRLHTVHCEE